MAQGSRVSLLHHNVVRLIRRDARLALQRILEKSHHSEIAEVMGKLSETDAIHVFSAVKSPRTKALVLADLAPNRVLELIAKYEPKEIAQIFQEFESDDAAYILNNLPHEISEEILKIMKAADAVEASQIEDLLKYEPNTAGSLMNVDVFAIPMDVNVSEVITRIQESPDKEFLFYLYVVDEAGSLVGVLSLRQLLMHQPGTFLKDIMNPNVIRITPDVDQEEVARVVSTYDLLAVPIVDDNNKLIGMITVDDVLDVIKDEATADILQMAGASSETDLSERSVWRMFRARAPWLILPCLVQFLNVKTISMYSDSITKLIAIAAFIPIINAMGGNVANQTASIVIRGISLGRFGYEQIVQVLLRELPVGVLIGLFYGAIIGVFGIFSAGGHQWFPVVVGLASVLSIFISSVVGTAVPLLLQRLDYDPTLATTTFCSAFMDITGAVIFLQLASFGIKMFMV